MFLFATRNPQPATRNPQPATRNPQLTTHPTALKILKHSLLSPVKFRPDRFHIFTVNILVKGV
jgi:hypothetical protein